MKCDTDKSFLGWIQTWPFDKDDVSSCAFDETMVVVDVLG